jgi:hypothetical protein
MPKIIRENYRNSLFESSVNIRNQALKLVEIPLALSRGPFNSYRRDRNKNYLLMNNNGKTVLGFAFVKGPRYGNGMNHLTLLATKQVYNNNGKKVRTGYGSNIMNAIYKNAENGNRKGVYVNDIVRRALGFYKKKGYVEVPNTRNMQRLIPPKSSPTKSPKRKRGSPNKSSKSP